MNSVTAIYHIDSLPLLGSLGLGLGSLPASNPTFHHDHDLLSSCLPSTSPSLLALVAVPSLKHLSSGKPIWVWQADPSACETVPHMCSAIDLVGGGRAGARGVLVVVTVTLPLFEMAVTSCTHLPLTINHKEAHFLLTEMYWAA